MTHTYTHTHTHTHTYPLVVLLTHSHIHTHTHTQCHTHTHTQTHTHTNSHTHTHPLIVLLTLFWSSCLCYTRRPFNFSIRSFFILIPPLISIPLNYSFVGFPKATPELHQLALDLVQAFSTSARARSSDQPPTIEVIVRPVVAGTPTSSVFNKAGSGGGGGVNKGGGAGGGASAGVDTLSSVDLEDLVEALQAAMVSVDTRDAKQLSIFERARRYLTGTYSYLTGTYQYLTRSFPFCLGPYYVANNVSHTLSLY